MDRIIGITTKTVYKDGSESFEYFTDNEYTRDSMECYREEVGDETCWYIWVFDYLFGQESEELAKAIEHFKTVKNGTRKTEIDFSQKDATFKYSFIFKLRQFK